MSDINSAGNNMILNVCKCAINVQKIIVHDMKTIGHCVLPKYDVEISFIFEINYFEFPDLKIILFFLYLFIVLPSVEC